MPTASAKAMTSCPTAITPMPAAMIGRAPKRSSRSPTGICIAPYTASWMTANIDRVDASASKRTAASTPTDDSDVRFTIETT